MKWRRPGGFSSGPSHLGISRPVSRVLYGGIAPTWQPFLWGARCRAPQAANPSGKSEDGSRFPECHSYLALLPMGFALPPLLPATRCALTAPFHPYLDPKTAAVSSLWHFPWGRPRRALSGTVSPWSPDFPRRFRDAAARPTDVIYMRAQAGAVKKNGADIAARAISS